MLFAERFLLERDNLLLLVVLALVLGAVLLRRGKLLKLINIDSGTGEHTSLLAGARNRARLNQIDASLPADVRLDLQVQRRLRLLAKHLLDALLAGARRVYFLFDQVVLLGEHLRRGGLLLDDVHRFLVRLLLLLEDAQAFAGDGAQRARLLSLLRRVRVRLTLPQEVVLLGVVFY